MTISKLQKKRCDPQDGDKKNERREMRIDTTTWFTVLALIKNDAWWSIAQVHLTRTHILHRYARHSIRERERVYDMKCDLTVGRVTVYRSLALVVPVNRTQITDSAMTATPCVQTWSIERTTFPIRPNVGIQMNLTVFWDLSFEIEIKFDFMRKNGIPLFWFHPNPIQSK